MKRKTKNMIIAVGAFLLAVLMLVLIGKASNGFSDFDDMKLRRPNDKNLWQSMTVANDGKIANGEDGLTVKVNEDGQVKINGTSQKSGSYVLATGTLKSGTSYVFDAGLGNGSNKTFYVVVRAKADSKVLATCYTTYATISAQSADTEVEVVLMIGDKDVDAKSKTLNPVLSVGTEEKDLVAFWK